MLRRSFLSAVIAGFITAKWSVSVPSQGASTNVIDAMPTFWKFWDSTIQQPDDVRVHAFFGTVVAAYPDLFHHGLIASGALTDLGSVPEAQERVSKYLQDVKPYIPAMRRITTNIHENFSRYVNDFSSTFPDYAPTTPVYFTVSLFGFSGGMNFSDETTGLYFGIDELARIHGLNDNLKIIFEHELFHQYHYQIAPEISANQAAWAYMWEEGLATYVSRQMSPGCTIDQALVIPSRLSELAKPHLRELAQRFLDKPDSTDSTTYVDLFSPDKAPPGLPIRSGYYLGFRVAELLGATRSLTELAHLRGPELKRAVLGALTELRNPA
jgi:hypothetical protein